MRLIDADALRNKMFFSEGLRENGILYVPFNEVVRNINDAPTSYDVEKIVAELEEASHWEDSTFDEDGYCNDDAEEVIYLHRAIDIVKRGGVK